MPIYLLTFSMYSYLHVAYGKPIIRNIDNNQDIIEKNRGLEMVAAYDCHSSDVTFHTISTMISDTCIVEDEQITERDENIQLVQKKSYRKLPYLSCFVSYTRIITDCSWGQYSTLVKGGVQQIMYPMKRGTCYDIHKYNSFDPEPNKRISGLKRNGTTHQAIVVAGKIDNSGDCKGSTYNDYDDVVVQADYRITLYDGELTLDTSTNQVRFPDGYHCPYSNKECTHPSLGNVYWDNLVVSEGSGNCFSVGYDILYSGTAKRVMGMLNDEMHTTYVVSGMHKSFALEVTKTTRICNYIVAATEHPALYILTGENRVNTDIADVQPINIDFSLYVNSKFVLIERHFKEQSTSMYKALRSEQCKQKLSNLRNVMALSRIDPQEFAYAYMGMPGYIAFSRGEVVHLGRCISVPVTIRYTELCYNELPVTFNNSEYFLSARSRILQKIGTQIPCSLILPVQYQILEKWYIVNRGLHETKTPDIINNKLSENWTYKSLPKLLTTGIYSTDELDKYRSKLMFPTEQLAVTNIINMASTGHETNMFNVRLDPFITEQTIESVTNKMFTGVTRFWFNLGKYFAPVLAVAFIWKILLRIIGCGTNTRLLHNEYGLSWKILFCCIEPLAWYFLHMAGYRKRVTVTEEAASAGADEYSLIPRSSAYETSTPQSVIPLKPITTQPPVHDIDNL